MDSYPSSPSSDPLDTLHFSSDSSSSPYSSSSSSYPSNERAPSPFTSPFPPSFDTPQPHTIAAPNSSWNGLTWPTQPQPQPHRQHNHEQQQQYATYHNGDLDQYHQQQYQQQHQPQQQQQHSYYLADVPYTATIAQSAFHSNVQQPPPSAAYNPYVVEHSSLHPHAVPALIIPTSSADPSSPATSHHFPDSAAPSTPPPPPIKFGDVFKGATNDMAWRTSQPVRPLNHAQMRVWQQFESGDTVRSISDHMGLKPHVVLNYIIYALESYSPAPSHPIFIHWPRFSIPPELMERVSAAMLRVGGALGRLDVVKERLSGGGALDEDVRIAMIRWKMERALGTAFKQYDVYRVMSAQEAAERLARQRKEDAGDESGGEEERKEQKVEKKRVEEESKEDKSGGVVEMVVESQPMSDDTNEAKQPPQAVVTQQPSTEEAEKRKERETMMDMPIGNTVEPTHPPALTASEMLFQLSLNGGTSQRCLIGRFERDWGDIEAVLSKLITDQLAWKRGLLYCPS